jgi:hypothetical protein
MLILAIISFLIGVALGLRFKVLILVPAIGLALAMVAVHGIVVEDGVWRLVGTMVVVATFIQLGYLGGSVLHSVIGASRAADYSGASKRTSTEVSPSGQLRGGASGRFEKSKHLRQA